MFRRNLYTFAINETVFFIRITDYLCILPPPDGPYDGAHHEHDTVEDHLVLGVKDVISSSRI